MMKTALLLLLTLTFATAAHAGVRADLRQGGKLYKEGKYGAALSKYVDVAEKEPHNQKALYNAGNAYYELKEYANAQEAYQSAQKEEGSLNQSAAFNLGNAYYRAGEKEKAISAYQTAILRNLDDKEAIHNLQLVLSEKNNQNEQNQNNKNQNKDSKNQDKKNQDNKGQAPQEQTQDKQNSPQEQKTERENADRVMQMAKENEHKQPTSSSKAPSGQTVEKDW